MELYIVACLLWKEEVKPISQAFLSFGTNTNCVTLNCIVQENYDPGLKAGDDETN